MLSALFVSTRIGRSLGREFDMSAYNVTVGMPVHNARYFITDAIASVLSQDYKKFELIIVDDASTDGTAAILNNYRKIPNIRIVTNKKRLGRSASRNIIIKLSKGRYLSACDADDLMLQGNLRVLSGYLDRHPDVGVVYGDMKVVKLDRKGKIMGPAKIRGRDCNHTWDLFDNAVNHPGSMLRKSEVLKAGGYDETVSYVDDLSLWLKMAEITRFKYLAGKVYYVWRRHPHSHSMKTLTSRDRKDLRRIRFEAVRRRYKSVL